jgi:hypothetical protein
MTTTDPAAKVEVHDIAGYVVLCSAELATDAGRWRPVVSIGEDRRGQACEQVPIRPEDLHDSEAQAIDRADVIARKWIRASLTHTDRALRRA